MLVGKSGGEKSGTVPWGDVGEGKSGTVPLKRLYLNRGQTLVLMSSFSMSERVKIGLRARKQLSGNEIGVRFRIKKG